MIGRKKKSLMMLGLVLGMVLAVLATLLGLSRHVPDFYRTAEVPPRYLGKDRSEWAALFFNEASQLGIEFSKEGGLEKPAQFTFNAHEINSFFKENLFSKDAAELEKQGISDPRINFDKDRLRLAFRYKNFFMTSVISLEMCIWLVPTETNTFAVEILNRRAGALPFPTQALLEEISGMARKRKIEVTWYRHNGHPVALVRVQSNSSVPTVKFTRLDLQPGKLILEIFPNEQSTGGQVLNRPTRSTLPTGFNKNALIQQASPTP